MFQRTRDQTERLVRRDTYYSAFRKFRARSAQAKEVALRKISNEQTKKCLFGDPFKLAFNKFRPPVCLPSLLCPDGTQTVSQAHSARVSLDAQIRKDSPQTDIVEHAQEREVAAQPYPKTPHDIPFTEFEVQGMVQSTMLR
ncbi:hypothetical protein HPB48_006121 [Haemaphysalis longicornis]|uniref:Uncharacterized protein n=1 Tax=Haemaphysalis longicornis TaxID=44386 RepID=A0A9J6FXY4_HAELO|nr:hypothetical protein HPB48_006121 [Haemaphysalis longicornis]